MADPTVAQAVNVPTYNPFAKATDQIAASQQSFADWAQAKANNDFKRQALNQQQQQLELTKQQVQGKMMDQAFTDFGDFAGLPSGNKLKGAKADAFKAHYGNDGAKIFTDDQIDQMTAASDEEQFQTDFAKLKEYYTGKRVSDPAGFNQSMYQLYKNTGSMKVTMGMFQDLLDKEIQSDAHKSQLQEKEQMDTDKMAQGLKNDLDADKSRAGNLGDVSKRKLGAERLQTLIKDEKGNIRNLPPQQVREAATALSAMLAPGGTTSEGQIDELVPKSAQGDAIKRWNWFTGDPNGADQQKFLKVISDTADRESKLAENQIKNIQNQRLSAHAGLKKRDPDLYNNIVNSYMTKPEDVFGNENQAKGNAPVPQAPAVSAPSPRDIQNAASLYQKAKGDPKKLAVFYKGWAAKPEVLKAANIPTVNTPQPEVQ